MSNPTLPELLAQMKARCDAATPGPWGVRGEGGPVPFNYVVSEDGKLLIAGVGSSDDASFIAHARTDIEKLIGLVDHFLQEHAPAGSHGSGNEKAP